MEFQTNSFSIVEMFALRIMVLKNVSTKIENRFNIQFSNNYTNYKF